MTRHRANMLAPPPPSPEIAQSAAYRRLPASAKALLLLIEIEVAEQGMLATIDIDDACAASRMRRPDFVAALDQLAAAGFVVTTTIGKVCTVAPSSAWRRT